MHKNCRLAAFLMLVAIAQPAAASPAGLDDFQQQAAEILEANRIPGAGIALVKNGDVLWAGGIGYADLAANHHVLGDTRFRIGSITKIFTALAVLQLVEDGKLALDQPVRDVAPEVPVNNPFETTDPVRVAHLLEHTAGFDDMHFRNMNTDAPLPDSLRDIVQGLEHELDVRWRPGVMHSYSNPGYAVVAYLVEKVSGMPFHRYVDEHLLAPLGMQNARWNADESIAQGYTMSGDGRREVKPRAIHLYPAGQLAASSRDLAHVLQLLLQRGEMNNQRIASDDLIERMETPVTTRAARNGLMHGYGLGNHVITRDGFPLHGHSGGLDGFISELAYSPEHGFGYVVLLNRVDARALHALGELAVAYLANDIASPEAGDLDDNGVTLPLGITGCYRMMNSRNEVLRGLEWLVQVSCINVDDGRAVLRHPVLPQITVLDPVRANLLRESGDAWPSAVFMNDGESPDALEWAGIYFERSNRLFVTLPLVLAMLALLLMFSAFLFFPVWLVRWWRGRLHGAPAIATRVWPLVASALFVLTVIWSLQLELSLLDSVNAITAGIFIGGVAFVVFSFFALYRVLRTWNAGIHPAAKWHSLLVASACALVALYLLYWKLVPLRLWTW